MEIVNATNGDIAQILRLHFAGLDESGSRSSDTSLDADLNDVEASYFAMGGTFLIAVDSSRNIMGMGALRVMGEGEFEVKRMRVSPAHRRNGVAKAILSSLLTFAAERGGRVLFLDTAVNQVAAQALYESFGFMWYDTGSVGGIESLLYKLVLSR